ncbi:MAG: D-alanyl-D-alanine carboxypeptidase/D-alanyl-D-alanine-endopeptidase [Pseudomonadota bacterium]
MIRRLALATLLASMSLAHAQLPEPVSRLLGAAKMPDEAMSALVLRGNTTVLSHLAERPMAPASTMKLVTTMVALDQLGPVFKGRTELRTTGEVVKGVLKGDLILRGGADADFSGEVLEHMLQSLRNQGIRKIGGKLVLDRSLFNPGRMDVGVPPFDEAPEAYYNVIPDALMVNKNMLQLDLRSNGEQLQLVIDPPLEKVSIAGDMSLVDAPCPKWEDGWKAPEVLHERGGKLKVMLHGTFPKNCARTYAINVLDRQDYLDRLFRLSWKKLGGAVSGETVDGTTPAEARLLAEHLARALPEVVRDVNKPSDNTLARTLFLSLGSLEADAQAGSHPIPGISTETTFIRSDLAVRSWMRAHGINDAGLILENGSGLSRMERISPLQLASLLKAGLQSKWAPEFQASMPIVGIDGTMRRRLKDSPAAEHARMKTGTLKDVVAIAGYVTDAGGQQCIVVAMINHDLVGDGKGRAALDALVDWVARSNAPAAP